MQYAGSVKLNKLIVLYDANTLLSSFNINKKALDIKKTYQSYGFKYIKIDNADYKSISKAISKAKNSNKPTFIEIKPPLGELSSHNLENYYTKSSTIDFDQIDEFKEQTNFKKGDFFDTYSEIVEEYKKVFEKNNKLFNK
ncbi:putative transketolase [Chlamydia trachomatis]|nr:putative transketolase [Chlamydia trachomatis]